MSLSSAKPLYTQFGTQLDPDHAWGAYPRPQLRRDSFLNLNGHWDYAIRKECDFPSGYDGKILVPFSPEAPLSGVLRQLQPDAYLFYRTGFTLPENFMRGRILLHFGAVDQTCEVYLNGEKAGEHTGGFLPFTLDVTQWVHASGENVLTLRVRDVTDTSYYSRGKQRLRNGNIWYTAQSGIWQTVWLESVPEDYVTHLRITPDYDRACVRVSAAFSRNALPCRFTVRADGAEVCHLKSDGGEAELPLENFRTWSPEDPFLYDLEVECGEDRVVSYFGMRKISEGVDANGNRRIFLNNRPYFHNGLLDQGYWPDGLLTPPSEEAIQFDLTTIKGLGFNMLRKHIKIEPERWYYACDRLGILIWQDFVNGGRDGRFMLRNQFPSLRETTNDECRHYRALGRKDAAGREMYLSEARETVELLYNHPCIVVWVPFNEGWGQFDSAFVCSEVKKWDQTRLVDHASGWHDQGCGDFNSRHDYSAAPVIKSDHRIKALTEFGGLAFAAEGHLFNPDQKMFGYQTFKTLADQDAAYRKLYEGYIIAEIPKGLSACVYTQVTDVEGELNGLMTYDREVLKLNAEMLREINKKIMETEIDL